MCTNALPHQDFLHLSKLGGPTFRSLAAASAATLFRTAAKTVTHWPEWKKQLQEAAIEFLPFESWGNGICSTSIWDSQPIALNLDHAFRGFPGDPKWSSGTRLVIQEIYGGNASPGAAHLQNLRAHFQQKVYRSLVEHAFPCTLEDTIRQRVSDLFAPFEVHNSNFEFPRAFELLRRLRKHDAMRVLKTWVNSWAISDRCHEAIRLPCMFGCDGATDKMAHYVMCPILFALLTQFRAETPACPLKRIGLIDPSKESLLTLACSFAGYHAVRRANIASQSNTLTSSQRHAAHQTFADFFLGRGS